MAEVKISEERKKIYSSFQKKSTSKMFLLFLIKKLPSAFFSGVRVVSLTNETCKTSVPYKWFSQNPFRSTYFACQAMAAELSTGLPAIMAIQKRNPRVSMLVVDMKAEFVKKAVEITIFECVSVKEILLAVETAVATGEGQTIESKVIGTDSKGNIISTFYFTWSFKPTSKK